jgi:protein-S-isoprenylcysteine O-methyltransferase Ste14
MDAGRWLFRHRAWLPVALLGLVLAQIGVSASRTAEVPVAWTFACLGVSLLGFALRVHALGHAAPRTSGRDRDRFLAESLNTTGAYSVTRHPLYLANLLMWLGPVLVPRSAWLLAAVLVACWLFYRRILLAEEDFLRREFGGAYRDWAGRTPAFLPAPGRWVPPARPFNLRAVLRREYSSLFQLVLVFVAINALQWRAATGQWRLSPFWLGMLIGGSATAGLLRLLWKRTGILQDPVPETKEPARQSRAGPDVVAGDAGVPSRLT